MNEWVFSRFWDKHKSKKLCQVTCLQGTTNWFDTFSTEFSKQTIYFLNEQAQVEFSPHTPSSLSTKKGSGWKERTFYGSTVPECRTLTAMGLTQCVLSPWQALFDAALCRRFPLGAACSDQLNSRFWGYYFLILTPHWLVCLLTEDRDSWGH